MKDIVNQINKLKRSKNAVILSHNYQLPEIQDIADYVGDSLGLSIEASKTKADLIVFCGVHFMAETAAILCPNKKVVVPELNAGCPMADMITPEAVKKLRSENPGALVVAYVNTSAAVKAEADYCCTSSNAVKVVEKLKEKEIIFIPDKYLGYYVSKMTGKKLILYNGFCPTHARILPEHIIKAKKEHPGALVMVHPECLPEVIGLADQVASTDGMVRFVKTSDRKEFIIGTEIGLIYRLKKENPGKVFYPASETAVCPNMKKTTLDKVLASLETGKTEIKVEAVIAEKARLALERMVRIS